MALTLGDVNEYVTLLALLRFGIPIAFYFSQVAAVPHYSSVLIATVVISKR